MLSDRMSENTMANASPNKRVSWGRAEVPDIRVDTPVSSGKRYLEASVIKS